MNLGALVAGGIAIAVFAAVVWIAIDVWQCELRTGRQWLDDEWDA